jgi:hypothetical protein
MGMIDEEFKQGLINYRLKHYTKAIEHFNAILNLNQRHLLAQEYRSKAQEAINRGEDVPIEEVSAAAEEEAPDTVADPETADEETAGTDTVSAETVQAEDTEEESGLLGLGIAIIIVLFVVVPLVFIILIVVIIILVVKRKRKTTAAAAPPEEKAAEKPGKETGKAESGTGFCPNCGEKLKPGDKFCSGCGNKVD